MSGAETLAFVLGFIVGTVLVGALVLLNAHMRATTKQSRRASITT